MVKSEYSQFFGGDTPEQLPAPSLTIDQSRERVYGSGNMVMERVSVEPVVTEQKREGYFFDQIHEKASATLQFSLQVDDVRYSLEKQEEQLREVELTEKELGFIEESISCRLNELEEKEVESDLRQVFEATLMRLVLEKQSDEVVTHLKTQENKLGLLHHSTKKELEDLMSDFEGKKEEARLLFESVNEKSCELEKAEKDFDLKQRAETERRNKESEAREKELRSLEESINEKSAELKRKEETFELKLKEETEKWREENALKKKVLEIKEKDLEKLLKELELKQMELEERTRQQLVEAESRKRSNLELEPPLLVKNDSNAALFSRQAKKQKSHEANDGDIVGIVDKSDEVPKSKTCSGTQFHDFSNSMSSFAVDQVWALYDPRDEMPRIYAQIREIFDSQLSVTLLEHVKTTKDENSIRNACGRFEYGDTEIKSHLMFAHEMYYVTYANNVIVNPRKGETWALFRDWNVSWKHHPDLHKPPYRYDFVEVISEFEDLLGIAVAYMGRVEGFVSVFNCAEQHGLIKLMILPDEMPRFSHKVASVKLSGEEKEGIPPGSFELNPAATPSYDPVLEEVVEMKIQSEDCGKALTVVDQDGFTNDLPIIIN